MFELKSFRTQLLLFIIGLLCLVLAAVFIAVNQANQNNARLHLEETLGITSFTFQQNLATRNRILMDKARLLSGDFAFKEAVATQDHETILSALENHRMRVMADVMMLATLEDGILIADTLHHELQNETWSLQTLQDAAENTPNGEASSIQLLDGKPYQLVLTPLFTPEPSAWIVIGFLIDDSFSQELAKQTHSEVSLLHKTAQSNWQIFASTLNASQKSDLLNSIPQTKNNEPVLLPVLDQVNDIKLQNSLYLSLIQEIGDEGDGKTLTILQRSLSEALKPYMRLQTIMFVLFGLGLLFAVISATAIARSLSRPLEDLTQTVQSIDSGDYRQTTTLKRKDELGILSSAVNHMSQGLQERDQVRDLLGKVVSPEIATELLRKEIELGGEERDATILFSDIRGFTDFCEHHNPKDVLQLLNRYLSSMSHVIETHQGVIDKYIGDAIMALFGVPIDIENSPQQAVKAALSMKVSLDILNNELVKENLSPINIGIGINTGAVVAGNMGSSHRLNYTVIGDCVNLAARLEGLTKYFGVTVIVSESTAKDCKDIHFRELGSVLVKGKKDSIQIFEPFPFETLSATQTQRLEQHHQAIQYFKEQQWEKAQMLFGALHSSVHDIEPDQKSEHNNDQIMYQLYLDNIEVHSQRKPEKNWGGELVFSHK